MAGRPLTAKQSSFIENYCNPKSETYNNITQSAIKAGYSPKTANIGSGIHLLGNVRIKTGIEAYRVKNKAVLERTAQQLDDKYCTAYDLAQRLKQPAAMVSAVTGVARLYGLDKDNDLKTDQSKELDAVQAIEAKRIAQIRLADMA